MKQLSDAVNHKVSAQAISKYENGKMLPSSSVLVSLGQALDTSLDFLMSSQIVELKDLKFRRSSDASAKERVKAQAMCIEKLERYMSIEQILDLPSGPDKINELCWDGLESLEELEDRAEELRTVWRLGLDPIASMCDLLEEKGIKVLEDSVPESISGLACQAKVLRNENQTVKAVLVSNRINVERKRFTLAHELAHHLIRSISNPQVSLEKAMDRFAGAFLVPREGLRNTVGSLRRRVTHFEIMSVKRKYGVSASCIMTRLGQVGILPAPAVRNGFRTFARSWLTTEPEPMQRDQGFAFLEKPSHFERLVLHALGEELISPIRAATILAKPLPDVEQQVSGPTVS